MKNFYSRRVDYIDMYNDKNYKIRVIVSSLFKILRFTSFVTEHVYS